MTLKTPQSEIAGIVNVPSAGQLQLLGNIGGLQVRSLVITGLPDEQWATEFLTK